MSLKNGLNLDEVTVQGPDVFDTNGVFIHPAEYDSKLQDGQTVEVDVVHLCPRFSSAIFILIGTIK